LSRKSMGRKQKKKQVTLFTREKGGRENAQKKKRPKAGRKKTKADDLGIARPAERPRAGENGVRGKGS